MKKYTFEKYRKLIENMRLFSILIPVLAAFLDVSLNIVLIIALVLGLIDQIFIKPKFTAQRQNEEVRGYLKMFLIVLQLTGALVEEPLIDLKAEATS